MGCTSKGFWGGFAYFDTDSVYRVYMGARGGGRSHYMRVRDEYEKLVRMHLRLVVRYPLFNPFDISDLLKLYSNYIYGKRDA